LDISKIFAEFNSNGSTALPSLCRQLLENQKKTWPRLATAYRELTDLQTRSVSCGSYDVSVQYNPKRAVSSGAAVDGESIKNRPCFLCSANLPAEQNSIIYRNDYSILCNPVPIFDRHFTVAHRQHRPQSFNASFPDFLKLATDLAPDFDIFYNGPACGASAPDHLHFQAIRAGQLPVLKNVETQFQYIKETNDVKIYAGINLDRSILLLEAKSAEQLENQLRKVMQLLQKALTTNEEPMINAICSYATDKWRVFIFLREKHRPDAFFAEGEKRVFVSLGAIDMAGVIITPLIKNFNNLDAGLIRSIYQEVSRTEAFTKQIMDEI
jgi:hypothetical protein